MFVIYLWDNQEVITKQYLSIFQPNLYYMCSLQEITKNNVFGHFSWYWENNEIDQL